MKHKDIFPFHSAEKKVNVSAHFQNGTFWLTQNIKFFSILSLTWALLIGTASKHESLAQTSWPSGTISGLQHTGAIHFYVTSSNLEIELHQKDATKNRRGLTAILTGPDGVIHDKKVLLTPENEPVGTIQSATLKANNLREGVYSLLIISEHTRHLNEHTIAFSTNASLYMINSGAAHQDSERKEPIVFNGEDKPVSIFFKPNKGTFNVEVTHLPDGSAPLELRDGADQLIQKIQVDNGRAVSTDITNNFSGIWELKLPAQKGQIFIDGLNHNFPSDKRPLPVWTTSRQHYFDLEKVHWLIDPRRFARNVNSGEQGEIEFTVYNNSNGATTVNLQAIVDQVPGTAQVTPNQLQLPAGSTSTARVNYQLSQNASAGTYPFHLLASDATNNLQSFALGELKLDQANNQPIALPIPLNIYEHNQPYFAYEPSFPRENQIYYDVDNQPWVVTPDALNVFVDNEWKNVPVAPGQNVSFPSSVIGSDLQGNMYTIANVAGRPHLLRTDKNFENYLAPLPEGGTYMVETWMGGQTSHHIPIVTRYRRNPEKKQVARWARVHDLHIFIPQFTNNSLDAGDPILVSDNCVGMSAHSGIPSAVASEADLIHLVWGETSDPQGDDPGVPNYTSTYNRVTNTLSPPQFLAFSPPVNDVHNISSILIDSKGTRHIIVGAHGRPFQYLKTASGSNQWTAPVTISEIDQTYVGAVLDHNDQIHLFFRGWRRNDEFPGSLNAALFYQCMGQDGTWNQPVLFATPGLNNYSIFYHRVTTNRQGRTYVSFTYWSTWTAYRDSFRAGAGPRQNRLVLYSDNGQNWFVLNK